MSGLEEDEGGEEDEEQEEDDRDGDGGFKKLPLIFLGDWAACEPFDRLGEEADFEGDFLLENGAFEGGFGDLGGALGFAVWVLREGFVFVAWESFGAWALSLTGVKSK